jgi:hypothetical protein
MRATERDRGGAGRKLLIALLVIVVVLVAADRISNVVAQRYAADTIQSSQHLPKRPSVDITGFPFLTQLAAGRFDEVVLSDDHVPVGSGAPNVRLSSVRVTLHTVRVARDLSWVRADVADAVATMTYADLGRALGHGVQVRYARHGRIVASTAVQVLGQSFHGSISAAPTLTGDVLTFGATRVNGVGTVAAAVATALQNLLAVRLPLGGIPFDIRVQSLHADRSGLHLALVGRNLSYSR